MQVVQQIKKHHHDPYQGSLLMKLLGNDDDDFKQPDPPSPPSSPEDDVMPMRLMVVEPPLRFRPVKIEPYAENYWPHEGASFNYNEWTPLQVAFFLDSLISSRRNTVIDILNEEIAGSALYSCFLDAETSELFRRRIGYSQGIAMKLRMALGNIHNHFYNLI